MKTTNKEICLYKDCDKTSNMGFYCWKHNPYFGMFDPKEEEKRRRHMSKITFHASKWKHQEDHEGEVTLIF